MRCAALIAASLAAPSVGAVEVVVRGGAANEGQVLISVFDSEASWMKAPVATGSAAIDGEGMARADFPGVGGRIGVAVIYDRNGSGDLDTNILGIPTEAFAFSNAATALFGPPDWDNAAIAAAPDGVVTLDLETAER